NRGSVRVRSYIVEEPVHEEVRLREERVNVERRPVNEPARPVAKGAADDLMQERTVEVTETAEQAVVGKEARVTEQVVVGKDTRERVESIDDTVRRTKVEVEDGRTGERTRNPPPSERR
ncbi:MAG TPA: YsnF/AvaK domain-containing protein, partial [Tepidisphaeraceae bacterium]|nr:YsnF/AvaK domain-containing protein [Tepidisphaeraceae bacterium]